ncbi:MAG TPA: CHAT domain-containing protein, partial [Chloroflexi bacterium]|nr:CHAT domain-containing protein [Chloroflexota bacterium]
AGMAWEVAVLWLNEAAALAHLDDDVSPSEALDRARHVFTREQNAVWLAATDLYRAIFDWRGGALDSAREHALRARDAFSQAVRQAGLHSRVAQCEVVLGEVALQKGEVEHAAIHFRQGLERLEHTDVPAVSFACLYGLGRTEQSEGRVEKALDYYRRAVALIERLQAAIGAEDYKIAFLGDKLQVYEALIMLSLEVGTPEALREAFATLEQAKSRALLDALARESTGETDSPAETELLAEMERIRSELNWYYNRLNAPQPEKETPSVETVKHLTGAITRRERALKKLLDRWRSPDLAAAPRNPIWTVDAGQIQSALPDDALLLEFYTARDQIIVFGLDQETMWTQRLPASCSEVADALSQFRFQLNKFSYGPAYRERHAQALRQAANESLGQIYQALLAPVAGRLTADTLIVVPHGLLHYVPFQALFDGQAYLIDRKTVSYAPSATILHRVLSNQARSNGRPPLIMGLPDPSIPYARAEAEAIAALYPRATVRLGERATVEGLMENEQSPAFLHLSTHATFRADNPLFSALKLADGWVSVHDVYRMAHSAPLVTLSACETGRSQVAVGDELVGLCRGFFGAGAHSMVVSLWVVDDSSTARLMARFYEELQAGLPVNAALRTAQRAIKAEKGHPYYWAPFILTGDVHLRLNESKSQPDTYNLQPTTCNHKLETDRVS